MSAEYTNEIRRQSLTGRRKREIAGTLGIYLTIMAGLAGGAWYTEKTFRPDIFSLERYSDTILQLRNQQHFSILDPRVRRFINEVDTRCGFEQFLEDPSQKHSIIHIKTEKENCDLLLPPTLIDEMNNPG